MDNNKNNRDIRMESTANDDRQNKIVSHRMIDKSIIIETGKRLRDDASIISSDYDYQMKLHLNELPEKEE